MTMIEKYNYVFKELHLHWSSREGSWVLPAIDYDKFDMPNEELVSILKELVKDELIEYSPSNNEIILENITYKGRQYIENGFKKIEDSPQSNINYAINNVGILSTGANATNTININSKIDDLILELKKLDTKDSKCLIKKIEASRDDRSKLLRTLRKGLTIFSEFASIGGLIKELIPMCL